MTRVSSDALPALTGRRRVGAVQSGRFSGKQGGTAEIVFFCPCSLRGTGTFLLLSERRNTYVRSRQTMATPAGTRKPIQQLFYYQKGVFYYEKGYFSRSFSYYFFLSCHQYTLLILNCLLSPLPSTLSFITQKEIDSMCFFIEA